MLQMIDAPADANWPRLLSLSVHEFRTPITVVAGYIRMLLKDRAGPLSEQQRRLLEEAEKSCGRLSSLVAEMSELANLEAATSAFNQSSVDLVALLSDAVTGLPAMPDRDVTVEVSAGNGCLTIKGDPVRLKSAFSAVLTAVRRELVTSDRLCVRHQLRDDDGRHVAWIALGDADLVSRLEQADPASLDPFDEWRGGCGLSLAIARRVFAAHQGRVWSASPNARAGAVVMLPCHDGT
jgi:signal transduction histidine kinase